MFAQLLVPFAQGDLMDTGAVIQTIPWQEISVEVVLFFSALIALSIDAAGEKRRSMSFTLLLIAIAISVAMVLNSPIDNPMFILGGTIGFLGVFAFIVTTVMSNRPRLGSALITWVGALTALGMTVNLFLNDNMTFAVMNLSTGDIEAPLIDARSLLSSLLVVDGVSLAARGILCIFLLLVIPMSFSYLEERQIHRGEYYPLMLLATVGMIVMAATDNLLMVFVGVEIFSLALYVLTAFAKRDLFSQEAAIKYFILGSAASGVMLYGMALLYGVTGTTVISQLGVRVADSPLPFATIAGALVLTIVGLAFKVGLVPFHFWMPEVYQGAPTPVTAFMAGGTKVAAFVAFMRIFGVGLALLQWTWLPIVGIIGSVTMLVGALGAVTSKDVKRILGWSAITHAGYLTLALMGTDLLAGSARDAVGSLMVYLLAYGLAVLAAFGCVIFLEERGHSAPSVSDFAGLAKTYPGVALMMSISLLSLAGIPGTIGFVGKFAVFSTAIAAQQFIMVAIALIASVISAVFYLGIIVSMVMKEQTERTANLPLLLIRPGNLFGAGLAAMAVLILGLLPNALIHVSGMISSVAGG